MGIRALVVGGTSGTGYALACRLAAEPSTTSVIISGRNKPATLPHSNMHFRALDATSMRGIKTYTDAFKASETEKLDYLIMSQGVMNLNGRDETPEGIDKKMAVHYYGRQMLTRELLPSLTPDAKVISVYDSWSGNPQKVNWDDLDLKKNFSLGTAANHCMVMNDAMVQHFATTQNPGDKRHFIHAWPGAVKSNLGGELPWYVRAPLQALQGVIATKPDVWAERLFTGVKERVEEGENDGKRWHWLNQKGRDVKDKKIWTEEEMSKIAGHTWNLLDAAVTTKA
jgi:NAD(P)-dependent dehydrogenase (short-subunit alcohol dehydrogenase family)